MRRPERTALLPSSHRMVEADRQTGPEMVARGAAPIDLTVVAGRTDLAETAVVPMVRPPAGLDAGREGLMRVAAHPAAAWSSGWIKLTASWTKSFVRLNPSSANGAKEPAAFRDGPGCPALDVPAAADLGWECPECPEWVDAEWECPVWDLVGVDLEDALAMTLIAIRTADLKVAPKAVLNVAHGMAITAVPKVVRAMGATVDRKAALLHGTAIAMMTGMMTDLMTTDGMMTDGMMTGGEKIAASGTMTMTT